MRRGQFEIMGLAIVVVIISMGVFFLLSLSLNTDNSDPAGQFFNEQFAQNTLDAFLKSSHPEISCSRYDVKDFYQFFALPQSAPAGRCNSEDTKNELTLALTQAITEYQGVDFRFEVRRNTCTDDCDIEVEAGTCNPGVENVGRPGRQTIPKYPYEEGELEFVLWLCEP